MKRWLRKLRIAYKDWKLVIFARERKEMFDAVQRQRDKLREQDALSMSYRLDLVNARLEIDARDAIIAHMKAMQDDPLYAARKFNAEAELIFEGSIHGQVQMYEIKSWLGEYRAHRLRVTHGSRR